MPYDNPKQATAIFLNIRRRKGAAAAKAFARKHSGDMARGVERGKAPYRRRSA